MSGEIKITKTVQYENGTLKYTYQPGTINLPQSVKGFTCKTISVTTAEADLSLTELGTPGDIVLHSLEATTTGNSVKYGPKSSTGALPVDALLGILKPTRIHDLCIASSTCTIRWKATASTVKVQVIAFEV